MGTTGAVGSTLFVSHLLLSYRNITLKLLTNFCFRAKEAIQM